MSTLKNFIAVSLAGLLLLACSGTKVDNSWASPDYKGKIKNVYIIGIANNDLNRMMFENNFIRRLAKEGVKATPSYPDLPKDKEAEKDSIIGIMRANNSDSVLLTRVTGQETKATFSSVSNSATRYRFAPGAVYSGAQANERLGLPYYMNWHSYYSTGYLAVPAQPSVTKLVVLSVESVLYDLQTEELIWSARMETDLESNLEDMIEKFVDQTVKELKMKGFI